MNTSCRGSGGLAAACAIAALVPALGPEESRAQRADEGLEEILVTARRREESLQEVPTAISAFAGDQLEERSIETVANLNSVAPNLSVMGGNVTAETAATFRVRGIPGVAVYIDGVWQSTTDGLFAMSVVDVERIEVLRGPQGTLFGQTARAGAIHYLTRPPADEFDLRLSATVGEYNRRDIQGAVDIPLSDSVKTKFTVSNESRDGFLNNVVIDRNYGDVNDDVFRGDLLFEPSDRFSLRFNAESSNMRRLGPARVLHEITEPQYFPAFNYNTNENVQAYWNLGVFWNNVNNVSGYPGGKLGKYDTKVAWKNVGSKVDLDRQNLNIDWRINDVLTFRSITGNIESVREVQTDFDGAAEVSILERDFRNKVDEQTQELQLLGSHGPLDWVVGAYSWETDTRSRIWTWNMPEMVCDLLGGPNTPRRLTLTPEQLESCATLRARSLAGGLGVTNATFTRAANVNADVLPWNDNEGTAWFADLTWRITDRMTASFGYRSSDEDTTSSLGVPLVLGPVFPDTDPAGDVYAFGANVFPPGTASFDGSTVRASLQYQWTDDIMTYIAYSDGFGPGGQSNLSPNQYGCHPDIPVGLTVFPSEDLVNLEVGLRADWLGGRVRTNATLFTINWENIQVSQYVASAYANFPTPCTPTGPQATQIDRNGDGAPDVFPYPALFTNSVAEAEVTGLELESIWSPTERLRLNLNLGLLDTEYTDPGPAGTGAVPAVVAGTPFQQAPEVTLNLGLDYRFDFASGASLVPRFDYTFTDEYVLSNNQPNQRLQDSFGLLNARLTYDSGTSWSVALFGTNLTEEYYIDSGFYTLAEQFHFVTIGRPREIGLTFSYYLE